ncbi:MAG: hypothetical protein GXP29_00600 [Planctomycetes bacterium]|nr:hypothetical protein [Planctomycetota bacterium]
MNSKTSTSIVFLATALTLTCATGCGVLGSLGDLLGANRVTVRLINNSTQFDVDVEIRYGDENLELKDLLKAFGRRTDRSIPPGETVEFSRDCDELEAIFIDEAKLQAPLTNIKEDTNVLVDGSDFSCGDTIVYSFSHSAILIDFDISTSVQ